MGRISEHTAELDGHMVFWRRAEGEGPPVLWVHGVPDSSELWLPFLERAGGVAVDLPGFGRSGKRADFPYTIDGYAGFLERFCDHVGLERMRLVVHDWGAVALVLAQRGPERLERLVAIDVVPLLPGYRWHRVARAWRTPGVGELMMGLTMRPTLRLGSRAATPRHGPMPTEWIDAVLRHFDQGTQRAILRLYRSADPAVLAAAGIRLSEVDAPALVVWGERDPYIPLRFGEELARTLPDATFEPVSGAGHWPWLDRPDTIDRVVRFVTA